VIREHSRNEDSVGVSLQVWQKSIFRFSNFNLENGGAVETETNTGTFPIHIRYAGDASDSYIRGVAVLDSFARGIVLEGVSNLRVDSNVFYNNKGHNIALIGGAEIRNHITNNYIIAV
jgi:hypothetical protein